MIMLRTFKKIWRHVLKRHYDSIDSNKDRFSDREKEELFLKYKKNWLSDMETKEKTSKKELSSLISLNIVKHG